MPKEVKGKMAYHLSSQSSSLAIEILPDPDFHEGQEVHESNKQSRIIQFNGTPTCEKISNVSFFLLLLGLLTCFAVILAMVVNPEGFGLEVDDRYLRVLNDEATESDVSFFEKIMFKDL